MILLDQTAIYWGKHIYVLQHTHLHFNREWDAAVGSHSTGRAAVDDIVVLEYQEAKNDNVQAIKKEWIT